jgi:hypothetical protein
MTGSPLSSALQYLHTTSIKTEKGWISARCGGGVQSVVEERLGQEAAQQLLALVAVERLPRLSVLDHLNAPEEPGASDVADDGDIVKLFKRLLEGNLMKALNLEHIGCNASATGAIC